MVFFDPVSVLHHPDPCKRVRRELASQPINEMGLRVLFSFSGVSATSKYICTLEVQSKVE